MALQLSCENKRTFIARFVATVRCS